MEASSSHVPEPYIKTRFLVLCFDASTLSAFPTLTEDMEQYLNHPADVVLYCGFLTLNCTVEEMRMRLHLLDCSGAPLKLAFASTGDNFFQFWERRMDEQAVGPMEIAAMKHQSGQDYPLHLALYLRAKQTGYRFLGDGIHRFNLINGASLTVCVNVSGPVMLDTSPQDPIVQPGVDVFMTYSAPRNVLDTGPSGYPEGSSRMFSAVARSRPVMHCFGRAHGPWGAKLVRWKDTDSPTEAPTYATDVDEGRSATLGYLEAARVCNMMLCCPINIRSDLSHTSDRGMKTLFLNAATKRPVKGALCHPWLVDLDLPRASVAGPESSTGSSGVSQPGGVAGNNNQFHGSANAEMPTGQQAYG